MDCKVVSREFNVIGMKNKGIFKEYGTQVPLAAQKFLARASEISNHTGTEISIYEPPREHGQEEGIFYVGLIVEAEVEQVPQGMEYLQFNEDYATIRGNISQIGELYATLDKWIPEKGYEHATPDSYIVEVIYLREDGQEDVEVHIPIKINV